MKKLLFSLLAILLCFVGFSQPNNLLVGRSTAPVKRIPEPIGPGFSQQAPYLAPQKTPQTTLGDTYYDTQTYNSGNLMNRIYEYPDGTIGATWMHKGYNGTPDRGTAYAFFDGSAWQAPEIHLGSDPNNAFPSYAPWGPNGEIIAHYRYVAGDGYIKLLRRETRGQGPWTELTLNPPDGYYSLVWHSMMTSGDQHQYVHILALVYDDPYMGQEDALLYYRSPDGGETWDINGEVIEGLGVDYFPSISSLKYSWAQPVGNTIAFSFGFDAFDGYVFKSIDNGTTWQKITVYDAPYDPYDVPEITPVFGSGDGTSAVALDNEGKAHVVFSRMLRFHDIVTTPPGGWYYYPTLSDGLIYWNEDMPALDSTAVSSYTFANLQAGGNLIAWLTPDTGTLTIPSGQPDYGVGLTSQAQICINPQKTKYVVYSALAPDFSNGQYNYRHVISTYSYGAGNYWSESFDQTGDIFHIFSECAFPAVSPTVVADPTGTTTPQIIFQEDATPGTGSGEQNFINANRLFPQLVGTPESTSSIVVSNVYPNPAHNACAFKITSQKQLMASGELQDISGQRIQQIGSLAIKQGTTIFNPDISGLKPGIYFIVLHIDNQKVVRKILVH